jgi:hypothetical protein
MTEIKILPTVKYIDVYSLKAVGDLKRIFLKHWHTETTQMQVFLSFLTLAMIAELLLIIRLEDKTAIFSLDSYYLHFLVTAILIAILIIITSYYSARINYFFDHT